MSISFYPLVVYLTTPQLSIHNEYKTEVRDGGYAAIGPNNQLNQGSSPVPARDRPQPLPTAESSYNVNVSGGNVFIGDHSVINVGVGTPRDRPQPLPVAESSYNINVSGGNACIGDHSVFIVGAGTPRSAYSNLQKPPKEPMESEIVKGEIRQRMREGASPGELVEVPDECKGVVIGKGGDNLRHISVLTGAKVIRKGGEVYVTSGTREQREQAKVHIKVKIAEVRVRGMENEFTKVCCYVDGWNLPADGRVKLEQLEDRMFLPGLQAQYRLRSAEDYGPQDAWGPADNPSYLVRLKNEALESLRQIKREMEMKGYLQLDMLCHFGTAIVRGPDEEEAEEGEWTIDEATEKFQSSGEGSYWRTAFNQGVTLDENIFQDYACNKTSEEYITRYDLTYSTPCGHELRCKVWVARENVAKKLEDIEIPFSDVKNILEEIHFEDDATRSRCRGWLVLPSRSYLLADILFPGCEFDFRLTISGRTESGMVRDYVPKEEARRVLSTYLSEITMMHQDAGSELHLPEMNKPEGYHLIHKRCSRRSLYETREDFAIMFSEESTWQSDGITEESRESTYLELHCKEWDELLNSGEWEPEVIVERLPELFSFVRKVQIIVAHEMKDTETSDPSGNINDNPAPTGQDTNILTGIVTSEGGVLAENSKDIELVCPPEAVDSPVSIKITLEDPSKYYGLIVQKDLENDVVLGTPIFTFEPKGHVFKKPVTLTAKLNVKNSKSSDVLILNGTEGRDGNITWEDITHNSQFKMLDRTNAEVKIKMDHFSVIMALVRLTVIRVKDIVCRFNLFAFNYTMSVLLNENCPNSMYDELALLFVSKDVYEQFYKENETSALVQLKREGFRELHLRLIDHCEEKSIYNNESLQISVRVGEDYKLFDSQQGSTSLTVNSHVLWSTGEVVRLPLEMVRDVRVLCGMICVQGEYGHTSERHFCERDLCGCTRSLLGVKEAPFNLIPVAHFLKTPEVLMNQIKKSWKDEDEQLEKILQHWLKENDKIEDLASLRRGLEKLKREGGYEVTERGRMHVRHLRELAAKISGSQWENADLMKFFSSRIQTLCKAVLRDCCIELEDSAEDVERAASTTNHAGYLEIRRPIPKDIDVAHKYQVVCSSPTESATKTFLAIVSNLIQDIKEIFVFRGISDVQNGLRGLPKETVEQCVLNVHCAEKNNRIRQLICEVCKILEMVCLKNCGELPTSEIEKWGENLAMLSMLQFLKPFFQLCPQDIRLHKRLELFSGRLRDIVSDQVDIANDFFLRDLSNVSLKLIHFAKFVPSKLVRFELSDSSNSSVFCHSENVKHDSCHDTFTQQFHMKKESEDELQLHAVACVHLDGRICKKGAFESVIVLNPFAEVAFDRCMNHFDEVAAIKLKDKESENLRVVLCSMQKEKLSELLGVIRQELSEDLVDLRRSEVTRCHLKMRTIATKGRVVVSLCLIYKWGSESISLHSQHFVTLANSSAVGACVPEGKLVGLSDPLMAEEAALSLDRSGGSLAMSAFDQLRKHVHGQILCEKIGQGGKALAVPENLLESLSCHSSDSKQIVNQWKENFQLDQSSLKEPDPKTKVLIRCFTRTAKCSNRVDVVQHLREILPAGTTGPLLPEGLHVLEIPIQKATQLTIALSGGDEWKCVAEMLGLNPEEIRFLDRRTRNPADAFLTHIARRRHLTVGDLYDILCECGLPVIADKL